MVTDTFNKLVSSCHAKCVSTRYAEPDLNKGESVCIDRCVCAGGRQCSGAAQWRSSLTRHLSRFPILLLARTDASPNFSSSTSSWESECRRSAGLEARAAAAAAASSKKGIAPDRLPPDPNPCSKADDFVSWFFMTASRKFVKFPLVPEAQITKWKAELKRSLLQGMGPIL